VFEFKVLDLFPEHWTMAVRPCACGEASTKTAERLPDRGSGSIDEWEVRCTTCGQRAIFHVEVSAFLGHGGRWSSGCRTSCQI
jgi:hypothetical protein